MGFVATVVDFLDKIAAIALLLLLFDIHDMASFERYTQDYIHTYMRYMLK